MESIGAKMITLKDMAGLVNPARIHSLMPKLKEALSVPVDFHTHCTPGYGLASVLTAIIQGVDIVDTNIWWFGGGSAAPAIELIWIFCQKLGVQLDVNMEAVAKIRQELVNAREALGEFDLNRHHWPYDFDKWYATMPADIDAQFDRAIEAAKACDEQTLLDACHRIEAYFGFPRPNELVKNAEVPGGMYSNMVANLRALDAEDVLDEAMALIPKVRRDAGLVPLVTPTSQIVGSQAVALAIDRRKGLADYTTRNKQFENLVKGEYGHTPVPVDPKFREQITGCADEKPYDVNSYKKPENPELAECNGKKLAQNEEEYLLLELLPQVATTYLKDLRKAECGIKKEAPKAAAESGEEAALDFDPEFTEIAPMGGKVLEITIKEGDEVKPGDVVLVYEAMKMENDLQAEKGGKVKKILVGEGDVMATDQPIIEYEAQRGPTLVAPMGGKILEITVKPGDTVKNGDVVLVYEAMKMENDLQSDMEGVVKNILVKEGDTMGTDQPLIEFE